MDCSSKTITLAHLYPEAMDLYGDIGNVLALVRRCEWRGIGVELIEVHADQPADLSSVDVFVMGGGQDSAQAQVAEDLTRRGGAIRDRIDEGAAALVVCGGFQLFGTEYTTSSGDALPGIGVFDARTVAADDRLIGNVTIEARLGGWGAARSKPPIEVVGFENHAGRTILAENATPFGTVLHGAGNLGDGSVEGAVYRNAIGTYLHGPLLPRNPRLADHLIEAALAHRYDAPEPLARLDDVVEMDAHRLAITRGAAAGQPTAVGQIQRRAS
jgi:CobQ-like glutamine amidotransferase family enzyme